MLNMLKPKALSNSAIPEGMTLQQAHTEILDAMGKGHSQHHRIGQLYNYIVAKRLAEKAGFKDAKEFASKHLVDLSQATLSTCGAVAAAFSEPVARRFGITCLHLLLIYKEATDLQVNHEDPGNAPIEVPDEKGQVTTLPFGKCSVEMMRRALLRKRKPASTKPLPEETLALAEQYREAVASGFPHGVVVKVLVRNQKGKAVLDFKGVPVEHVGELAAVLKGEKPMVREVE